MADSYQPPEPPPLPVAFGPPLIGDSIKLNIDFMKKEDPGKYQLVLKLCKMALTYYQKIHAGEAYEFENLQEVQTTFVEYELIFRAKKCDDNTLATFSAVGRNFPGQELTVAMCNKLEKGWIDLMKKENPTQYQLILHLCKVALTRYQNSHPGESYEFESLLDGFQNLSMFTVTFCAKNTKANGNPLQTFWAVGSHLIGEKFEMGKCQLLK